MAGYSGTFTINGVDLQVTKWTGKLTQEELDTTNMASGGWKENIGGLKSLEGSFEATFDSVIYAGGTPFNISGQPVPFTANLGTSSHGFSGSANVFGLSYDDDVAGLVTVSGDFKSTGAVTIY